MNSNALIKDKLDRLVSRTDRAGRMADTQEYSNFIFYRNRFSQELIDETHRRFCEALVRLFDQHKHLLGKEWEYKELQIV